MGSRTKSEYFHSAIPDTKPQQIPRGGTLRKRKHNKTTKVTKTHIKQLGPVRRDTNVSAATVGRPSAFRKGADCFKSVPGMGNVMTVSFPDTLRVGYGEESRRPTPNGQSSKARKKQKKRQRDRKKGEQ